MYSEQFVPMYYVLANSKDNLIYIDLLFYEVDKSANVIHDKSSYVPSNYYFLQMTKALAGVDAVVHGLYRL